MPAAKRLNRYKHPTSYRWRDYDLELIETLINQTQEITPYPVNASKLIRGALFMASQGRPEELLDAIIESEKNSLIHQNK